MKLFDFMNKHFSNKYFSLLLAVLLLAPISAAAQRRGAQRKSAKVAYNAEEELTKARALFDAYKFEEAAAALETAIGKAQKAEADHSRETALLDKALLGAEMLPGTERVTFIDSTVVDSKNVLNAMNLSPECGRLAALSSIVKNADWAKDLAPAPAYVNQFGDKLLLAFPDSNGVKRISSSFKLGNGWTQPKPLEGMEGMAGAQAFPYLLADGVTLYFAKMDDEGLGGYDLFITRYDSQTKSYLKAENLGFPFNSPANDFFCIIDEAIGIGYLATDRNQPQGKVCIYRFIPNDIRETYQATEENMNDVRRAARIASVTESQKGHSAQIDAALARIQKASATDAAGYARAKVRLVINDDTIYTSLAQFKSPAARRIASDLIQTEAQMRNQQELQENLRRQWGAGNHSPQLKESILEMDKRLADTERLIKNMAKNMRKAELGL